MSPAQPKQVRIDSELLRQRLTLRNAAAEKKLRQNHPVAAGILDQLGIRPGKIRDHAAKVVTSGVLSGTLLLTAHSANPVLPPNPVEARSHQVSQLINTGSNGPLLASFLQSELPPIGAWGMTPITEREISQKIKDLYGINAVAELEGKRLNHQYGRMGAEQHLPRFPGDTAAQHGDLVEKGITPARGAWGYFANSKSEMTAELYETERWYVAVQTLYLPDWNSNHKELKDWYKYRRVVVVNPANGKLAIAAVADAGPAEWTGKHFGGSPELMEYLGINYGKQNHPVILFFLYDPEKKIPLGPVEYNMEDYLKLTKDVA